MADVAIESLLNAAARAPFGPLAVAVTPGVEDATWTLAARWQELEATIIAAHDAQTGILRLDADVACSTPEATWRPILLGRPWVMDASPSVDDERLSLRLWLADDALDLNTLLRAVAELVRFQALLPSAAAEAPATIETTEPAQAIAPVQTPAPSPRPAARPVAWQMLTTPPPAEEPAESAAPEEHPPVSDAAPDIPAGTPDASDLASPPAETPEAQADEPEPGYCRECGSPHPAEHAFCTNCGARLN
jgi:hypothetical protein